jgi:GxxExxY protein
LESADINNITGEIIGAAIEVHKHLGPGLLESAYEYCLCREFEIRKIQYEQQKRLPIGYKGLNLDSGYRVDILVKDLVVVEIKSVETILPVHQAQVLTYLKLGGWKAGLLINFNVPVLKQGICRLVNGLPEPSRTIGVAHSH